MFTIYLGIIKLKAQGFEVPIRNYVWLRQIMELFRRVRTFRLKGGVLSKSRDVVPALYASAHRVLLRLRAGNVSKASWFERWSPDSALLEQYRWSDKSSLINTSTAQLRKMQESQRHVRHSALTKWEIQLNCHIPENI